MRGVDLVITHHNMGNAMADHRSKVVVGNPAKLGRASVALRDEGELAIIEEHSKVSAALGLPVTGSRAIMDDMAVRQFLNKHDLPVYNLREVVLYMNAKSAKEGHGSGWRWLPLRVRDEMNGRIMFGHAEHKRNENHDPYSLAGGSTIVYSDFYTKNEEIYQHVVPLHALKKVELLQKEFDGRVKFMVSDYAPLEQYRPDPFLMVVVAAANDARALTAGEYRYVIDFWDEPGFGIDKQVK